MEEPWTKVWEVNVGEPSTYIPVKYSAYPEPIIKWCVHSNICFMHSSFHALKLQFQNWMDFVTLLLLCVPRFKNDLPLNDYRIKQKSDALVIREVKETDAGIYTVILTNKITKEEQRRSFQLLVNGVFFSSSFPFTFIFGCLLWIWLYFFLCSSSLYHREGDGSGHWCVPVRQQHDSELHCSWISRTYTHPVGVDVQRGLPRGFHASQLFSVSVKEKQRG